MVHGEDLDRRNGGSESSVHLVWGHRTQQDRPEQGPANNAIPMQPSYILFAASAPPRRQSALLILTCTRKKGNIKHQLNCLIVLYSQKFRISLVHAFLQSL